MLHSYCSGLVFFLKLTLLFITTGFCLVGQGDTSFEHTDKHALTVPKKYSHSINELTVYLTEPYRTDLEKVRAIYVWIGNNIKYDTRSLKNKEKTYNHNPENVLKQRKGVCTGYAHLFNAMAQLAGIESQIIAGYSKNSMTANPVLKQPDHVWNAIFLEGQWQLIDVTWDAGLWVQQDEQNRDRKDHYFLPPPAIFIKDHLPALPMWQLRNQIMGPEDFVAGILDNDTMNTTSLNFDSLINVYINFPPEKQRLFEYQHSYQYNPTKENGKAMAHGLLDYAGILTDSIQDFQKNGLSEDTLLAWTEKVVALCQEAEEFTNFHDWQRRMYADALVTLVVYKYNAAIKKVPPEKASFQLLLRKLEKAEWLIKGAKRDFWSQSALKECQQYLQIISDRLDRFE